MLGFAELDRRSAAAAAGLAAAGVRPGDRVLVQLPNSVESTVTLVAAWRAGAVVVPLPTAAGPAHLTAALADSGAKILVVPDEWRGVGYRQRLPAAPHGGRLGSVYVTGPGAPDDLAFVLLERSGAGAFEPAARAPDSPAALIYTSGSSGRPKGVLHSSNSLLAEVATGWAGHSSDQAPTTFVPLPPGHVGGLISTLIPLVLRRPAAYLEPWDRGTALQLIRSAGAAVMGAVPFFLIELLDESPESLAPLTFASIGGAGVPPVLVERADVAGLCVARSYGLTEHPTVTAGTVADPQYVRAHTDGRVTRGNRVRIVDPDGRDLPMGEVGEIVTRGPEMMLGYTDPEENLAAFLRGGWLRTGDLGRLEPGSWGELLVVTGRLKEIIIRGGENIAASEVEGILARHPDVLESAVIGIPDERYGERLLAVVVLRDGATRLTLADVRAHFAGEGASRLVTPERLQVVDALPRGATGKVQRVELRQRTCE
jgi:acyl-CoA synthetase (AMP-forming)/AMP-acid ligase II